MDTPTTGAIKQVYQAPKLEAVPDYSQLTMSFGSTIPETSLQLPSFDDVLTVKPLDF